MFIGMAQDLSVKAKNPKIDLKNFWAKMLSNLQMYT